MELSTSSLFYIDLLIGLCLIIFYTRQVFFVKGTNDSLERLTDVGCIAAEDEEEAETPEGGGAATLPSCCPGGHICAGSFGICAKPGPGKGERGAGYG